jgi:arylsulfatase A-like enzyme
VPSFNESDLTDKPTWLRSRPAMTAEQVELIDETYRRRLQTLQAADDLVVSVIETLHTTGAMERTYILLTSDNGWHQGEHRIDEAKATPYEEAIRVPLVARGPGVAAGETIPALASQVDLAPTFASWAHAAVPDFVDGRSLAPLLAGEAIPAWRQALPVELYMHRPEGSTKQPGFNALRAEDFVYIENLTDERELYDLTKDPYQLDNLAATANPDIIETLSVQLAAMTTCAGDVCRAIEDAPLPGQ